MTYVLNNLLVCSCLLLLLTKYSILACRCADQDNYSPPTLLSYAEHGAGGQSTTCSYNLHGVHYYCVFDSVGKLIQDNDLGYCPKGISGCAQGGMCPTADNNGTPLTDTIPQDDGTVTCAFGSGSNACLYDGNGNLKDDKNNGACPSTVSGGSATTKPGSTCPANDARGTALSTTVPQNDGSLVCAYGRGGCHYNGAGKLLEDQNGNACPSTTESTGGDATTIQSSSITSQTIPTITATMSTTTQSPSPTTISSSSATTIISTTVQSSSPTTIATSTTATTTSTTTPSSTTTTIVPLSTTITMSTTIPSSSTTTTATSTTTTTTSAIVQNSSTILNISPTTTQSSSTTSRIIAAITTTMSTTVQSSSMTTVTSSTTTQPTSTMPPTTIRISNSSVQTLAANFTAYNGQ